jgi:putative membrane protein
LLQVCGEAVSAVAEQTPWNAGMLEWLCVRSIAAHSSISVTIIAQGSFLAAGLFHWCASLASAGQRSHAATGAAALLFTSVHMTLLGDLLALGRRPVFGEGQVACFGVELSSSADQHLGGIVMLLAGSIVYLAGGAALVARLLRPDPAES